MRINQKLNPNAQKWVDELAHGKRKQCKNRLHVGNAFCCLGVACELAMQNGIKVNKSKRDKLRWSYEDSLVMMPLSVRKWLGLTSALGDFKNPVHIPDGIITRPISKLSALNDNAGYNFKQIAAFINLNPEGLFEDANQSTS